MSVSRRQLLLALATVAPSAMFIAPSFASISDDEADKFLKISQIITGNRHLNSAISRRIESALMKRIDNFSSKLERLNKIFSSSMDRNSLLEKLSEEETAFAFEIAKPWYLGFVGTPKGNMLNDDDAEFMTYLHAQSYELVQNELPRPGYPPKARDWWINPPNDLKAPPMNESIKDWSVQQPGADGEIVPADKGWKAYALGETEIKPS